jgi:hypothetical protein
MSQSRVAVITFLDSGPVDPGYGQVGGGNYPSQGLPGGGYPSQGLPGGPNYPSQGLPGSGARPDNSLPGFPGFPVHLPVYPFDPTDPGFGVGRPPRPDQGLPGSGARPDQGLPGSQPGPDNTLPSGGARPSQPIHEVHPGMRFAVKWLACAGLILVPDNSLPGGEIDNTLPETTPTPTPQA